MREIQHRNIPLKIIDEIKKDLSFFDKQLKFFIKKYMRWHFELTETSFLKNRLEKKTNFIYKRVTISSDAQKIARLDYDRNLSIYEISDMMKPIFTIYDIFIAGTNIRFSHNSKKIAFYDLIRKEINVWDIEKKEREFIYKDAPVFLTFSKIGDFMGIVLEDGIKIYENNSLISETNDKSCFFLDFAQNKDLVCIVVDQKISVWDFKQNRILVQYEGEPEATINCAYFLPSDSKIMAATANQQIILWDYNLDMPKLENNNDMKTAEKKSLITIREHQNAVLNALISQDEKYIFSYENAKQVSNVYIWKKNEYNDEYQNIMTQQNFNPSSPSTYYNG